MIQSFFDYKTIKNDMKTFYHPERAQLSQRFFKTGKGQYGEGDIFWGLSVPEVRRLAKKYKDTDLATLSALLGDGVHELRSLALIILTLHYADAVKSVDVDRKKKLFDFYIQHISCVNNWDLVDISAHKIVGAYLIDKPRDILYTFAQSEHLWTRRISIIATFAFIKDGDLKDALQLAEILVSDRHDLMHKAVGWVLREVGKKDKQSLKNFLDQYAKTMPRTMLRYSLEKFEKEEREYYMGLGK